MIKSTFIRFLSSISLLLLATLSINASAATGTGTVDYLDYTSTGMLAVFVGGIGCTIQPSQSNLMKIVTLTTLLADAKANNKTVTMTCSETGGGITSANM